MIGALLELGAILLLVVANGLLAGAEIAVVSSREFRLDRRSREGDPGAGRALELYRSPDRFLSAVQVGITAVAVVGGAFGGVRVAASLVPLLEPLGVAPEIASQVALVLTVLTVTFLMLVFGELVPKRIALRNPEAIASRLSGLMTAISRLAAPLIHVLGASTELALRMLPVPTPRAEEVTEDEISGMVARARRAGVLEPTEEDVVRQIFKLSDRTVADVMVPRHGIVWLDVSEGPDRWRESLSTGRHTRYVVADGDLDRSLGYVTVEDLLTRCVRGESLALEPVLKRFPLVPEWTPALRVLELLRWSRHRLALVTGPEGEVRGLVTLHDVLEGVVGDIPEPYEVEEPQMIERDDGSWLVDGLLPFEDFLERLGREPSGLPHFDTVHTFVVSSLDDEPRAGASFRWRGLRFEVADMDGRKVDKVLVSTLAEAGG